MISAYAALALITTLAAITARKKIVHAASWAITGLFALWAAAFPLAGLHSRWHKAGRPKPRHAAPKVDEDAKTIAWLARLHERPARVMALPFLRHRARVQAVQATLATVREGTVPVNVVRARLGLPELVPAPDHGVPWADVDQYLTDDAMRHEFNFDAEHPQLAGEAKPWPGPFVDGQDMATGWQYGDMVFPAPMGCVPEPPLEPLPPRPCPDVQQASELRPGVLSVADAIRKGELCNCAAGQCAQQWNCIRDPEAAIPEDVPGPAETASPPPPSGNGAEAATPPAVASAGPGTTTPPFDPEQTGQWDAYIDWCKTGPLDQVRAVAR